MNFLIYLLALCTITVYGFPNPEPHQNQHSQNDNLFVLAPVDHDAELPKNAIEVTPHHLPTENKPEDHVLHKKIIALPIAEVGPDTEILANEHGHAVVAKHADSSLEDLVTAESIVFRPLFAYRQKMAKRRRVYQTAQRRVQNYYPTSYPTYYPKYNRIYYRDAEFPAIA